MKKLLILALVPWLFACNPDKNNEVIIGHYTDNLHVVKLVPNIVIPISSDAKDSLDLNADNNYDIFFIKSVTPMTTGYTYATFLGITNGTQIALSDINNYPDSLNTGVQINDNLIWTPASSDELILASYAKRLTTNPIGNYRNVINKYLGFKIDGRFGWIKLDNAIAGDLVVKEFVISE
jgi:hypothetical protein